MPLLTVTMPRVVIVGRPNVGKSSLLNRMVGRRVSIVEPTAGVTRDRVAVTLEHQERRFEVVDTGGLGLVDEALLKQHIEAQIDVALHDSDLILFVVDAKEGLVPGDQMVAQRLRRLGKPVLLVANKVESRWDELAVHEWAAFGFGEPFPVSALEGFGITDLLDQAVARLPERSLAEDEADTGGLKFAVVGKRNSGKSTWINRLVGEERVIVSELPGTTRDSVDVVFDWQGKRMTAIDTAGVRKKRSIQDAIELFSYGRATTSIRRADVVVLLFDIRADLSQVDKKVAAFCVEHHKPVLLCGNKIDLADDLRIEQWDAYIRQQLPGLSFAPVSFISALEGRNVDPTLDVVFDLRDQARTQIPTSRLNEILQEARTRLTPRSPGKIPKLFYGTQIDVEPLTILIFVNEPELFRGQYTRYLQNRLREAFDCEEVPLRLIFRRRSKVELPPLAQD
ncbi:MAG: ribosome biogenesis GTPase Der [Planctomycetota bacterium]